MKKKQTKHFVPDEDSYNDNRGSALTLIGIPACKCYRDFNGASLKAFRKETAKTRRGITCGNCQRTRVFRKLK